MKCSTGLNHALRAQRNRSIFSTQGHSTPGYSWRTALRFKLHLRSLFKASAAMSSTDPGAPWFKLHPRSLFKASAATSSTVPGAPWFKLHLRSLFKCPTCFYFIIRVCTDINVLKRFTSSRRKLGDYGNLRSRQRPVGSSRSWDLGIWGGFLWSTRYSPGRLLDSL